MGKSAPAAAGVLVGFPVEVAKAAQVVTQADFQVEIPAVVQMEG